jgi:hypothetical protein
LCSSSELLRMNINSFLALFWFPGHPDTVSQSEFDSVISTPWEIHLIVTVLQFCALLHFNYRKQPVLYTDISFTVITFWTLFFFLLCHWPTRYSQNQSHNLGLVNSTYFTSISTTICLCKQEVSKSVTFISLSFPVTGCGGSWVERCWGFPHSLDSQLTHGGQVVSLMCWLPFTPRKIPGTHFC